MLGKPVLLPHKNIVWRELSYNTNPALLSLFEKHLNRENNYIFAEELCSYVFQPKRVQQMAEHFGMTLEEWMEHL